MPAGFEKTKGFHGRGGGLPGLLSVQLPAPARLSPLVAGAFPPLEVSRSHRLWGGVLPAAPAAVVEAVLAGPPVSVRSPVPGKTHPSQGHIPARPVPDALAEICERAMSRDAANRYATA